MHLLALTLEHFRNYSQAHVELDPGLNLILGDNAQGKTNFLEAVYYVSRGRSFKSVRENDIIQFGEDWGKIKARIDREGRKRLVEVDFAIGTKRTYRINDIPVHRQREIRHQFDTVIFAPEDLRLIKGSPEGRRRFMDEIIEAVRPSYRTQLQKYNRILYQRNQLLKKGQGGRFFHQQMDALDTQMVKSASEIILLRAQYVDLLQKLAGPIHQRITRNQETLKLVYKTPFDLGGDIKSAFAEGLAQGRKTDMVRKQTSQGPHRDDLEIFSSDLLLRDFGSQGQQRTAALTLRIAELELLEYYHGSSPILLLDDVFSELDDHRSAVIVSYIQGRQSLVTANTADSLKRAHLTGKTFAVVKGTIRESVTE